jgi:phosphatase NudJ
MSRQPIPTWFFALVVVRRGDEFLLVHERKHGQLWYLPAGRCEPGEELVEAALRETLEESGVPVEIEGLLRFEHTPMYGGSRVRAIFVARPIDDTPPKNAPDEHSLEAAWVTLAQLERLPLRGGEVRRLLEAVAAGAPIYPLSVLGRESDV